MSVKNYVIGLAALATVAFTGSNAFAEATQEEVCGDIYGKISQQDPGYLALFRGDILADGDALKNPDLYEPSYLRSALEKTCGKKDESFWNKAPVLTMPRNDLYDKGVATCEDLHGIIHADPNVHIGFESAYHYACMGAPKPGTAPQSEGSHGMQEPAPKPM